MINLTKGSGPVALAKGETVLIRIIWPADTDYDAGAEILYKDGSTESIATFGASGVPAKLTSRNGTVRHFGDARRGAGTATEVIEVSPDQEIQEIAPWAYSAQSNGTGSFRKYAVTMEVVEPSEEGVRIESSEASANNTIYTCVPGLIQFRDGQPFVSHFEGYSLPGSESRPAYRKQGLFGRVGLSLDGPRNDWK